MYKRLFKAMHEGNRNASEFSEKMLAEIKKIDPKLNLRSHPKVLIPAMRKIAGTTNDKLMKLMIQSYIDFCTAKPKPNKLYTLSRKRR